MKKKVNRAYACPRCGSALDGSARQCPACGLHFATAFADIPDDTDPRVAARNQVGFLVGIIVAGITLVLSMTSALIFFVLPWLMGD